MEQKNLFSKVVKPTSRMQAPQFIGGEFVSGHGQKHEVTSPWFGEVVGEFHYANNLDLDLAIEKAEAAFPDWSRMPMKERAQILFRFREILMRDIQEISHCISLENGKMLAESRAGLMKGIEVLEYALSLQNADQGGKMEVSRGVFCEYRREALGVVASITPFNFPAMVPMWTIPIALALGNCFVWKPSEKTPLTSFYLAKALQEAGIPKGVFTVLQGGVQIVEGILAHPKIKAVSFVGSTSVAKLVFEKGSQMHKRVLALGGAKNHIFLMPDADLGLAGKGIADSFTGCAGQRCMAASVLLPVANPQEQIQAIIAEAQKVKLGESMGALISREQVQFLKNAISQAESEGAKILLDGRKTPPPAGYEGGFWLGPTIIDQVKPGSMAATRELFGPVLSIVRTQSMKEAISIENENLYGNAASVFTNNGAVAEFIAQNAKAGMIGVNVGVPVPREPFSFGGIQESKFGHGDITGENSLNFWSDLKKVTTKWQSANDATWMS